MKKAWKAKKGMDAREWTHQLFLFRFEDANEINWVIKNQPWQGNLFLIRPLEKQEQPSNIKISEAQLWIHLYDAPISCMNLPAAKAIAGKIGNFLWTDPNQDFFGKFMRIKIAVNVEKPLLKSLKILVGGDYVWISIKYEALPIYCFNCGRLGHALKYCDSADHSEELKTSDLPFGPEMKASPFKKHNNWTPRGNTPKASQIYPIKSNTSLSPSTSSSRDHFSSLKPRKIIVDDFLSPPQSSIPAPTLIALNSALDNHKLSPQKLLPEPATACSSSAANLNKMTLQPNEPGTPSHPLSTSHPTPYSTSLPHSIKSADAPSHNRKKKALKHLARNKHCTSLPLNPTKSPPIKRPLPNSPLSPSSEQLHLKKSKRSSDNHLNLSTAETATEQSRRAQ